MCAEMRRGNAGSSLLQMQEKSYEGSAEEGIQERKRLEGELESKSIEFVYEGYMGEQSGELAGLEASALLIRSWFRSQGVGEEGAARAVRLLNREVLLNERRPARWNRRGQFGPEERCRYMWYRHSAKILGWCERHQFPAEIREILRNHCFPSPRAENEEARTHGASSRDISVSTIESTGQ